MNVKTRDEIIAKIEIIRQANWKSEEERGELMDEVYRAAPCPNFLEIIMRDGITSEDVLDAMLRYRPILL